MGAYKSRHGSVTLCMEYQELLTTGGTVPRGWRCELENKTYRPPFRAWTGTTSIKPTQPSSGVSFIVFLKVWTRAFGQRIGGTSWSGFNNLQKAQRSALASRRSHIHKPSATAQKVTQKGRFREKISPRGAIMRAHRAQCAERGRASD